MTITDRDRKILFALIPLVLIAGYWFLLLAPKREEAATVRDELTQAEGVRDTAQQKASQLAGAKRSFAADYATVIRLGKSIPTSVDMPSLLVQLDRAAAGTGIKFIDVKAGARTPVTPPASPGTPGGGAGGPTAPGAPPAQSGPGQAAQTTSNAVSSANGSSGAAAGAAGTPGAAGATGTSAPGLETVPLTFEFRGSFFDLADFFHRMKRFVRVANNRIVIRGRLLTIDSFSFDTAGGFPEIKAAVSATIYLAPKAEGIDAGASPQGPAGTTPASTGTPPSAGSGSTPAPTPTAAVTSR